MKLFTHIGDVKGTDSYKKWMEMHRITGEYVFTEGKKNKEKSVLYGLFFIKQIKKNEVFRKLLKTFPEIHIELVWKL